MDPNKPDSFNHRTELLSTGRTYHFVDQLPSNYDPKRTPTLLLIHGFPDLWYGWRNQIGPWVRKGARVVAPDMLGYGGTDKPFDPVEYTTKKLSADLVALLDLLEVRQAIVIGHDWGSFTAQRLALWHPERLSALVLISVPYTPPTPVYRTLQDIVKLAPNFDYQLYFSSRESTKQIEKNLRKFISAIYESTSEGETTFVNKAKETVNDPKFQVTQSILNEQELAYYLQEFSKGMNGPLNYYRTTEYRFVEEKEAKLQSKLRADLPVFCIWGTRDPSVVPAAIKGSHKFIERYQDVALEGIGHWVMVEAKVETAEMVATWLKSLKGPTELSKL